MVYKSLMSSLRKWMSFDSQLATITLASGSRGKERKQQVALCCSNAYLHHSPNSKDSSKEVIFIHEHCFSPCKKKKVRGETEKSGNRSYLDIVPLLTET